MSFALAVIAALVAVVLVVKLRAVLKERDECSRRLLGAVVELANYRETFTPQRWDGKGPGEDCLLLIDSGDARRWVDCNWDSGEVEGLGGERARVAPYYVTPDGEDAARLGRITHWARHPDYEARLFAKRLGRAG